MAPGSSLSSPCCSLCWLVACKPATPTRVHQSHSKERPSPSTKRRSHIVASRRGVTPLSTCLPFAVPIAARTHARPTHRRMHAPQILAWTPTRLRARCSPTPSSHALIARPHRTPTLALDAASCCAASTRVHTRCHIHHSHQAKPSQAKPRQVKPSQAKSSQVKPSQAKSSQVKPSQAKSSQVKPSQAASKCRHRPARKACAIIHATSSSAWLRLSCWRQPAPPLASAGSP